MPVKDVRSGHVSEVQARRRDTPSMANHVVSMLSKMHSSAAARELVPHGRNPRKRVRHDREKPRERFPPPDEYRSVGAALREAESGGSPWPPATAAGPEVPGGSERAGGNPRVIRSRTPGVRLPGLT